MEKYEVWAEFHIFRLSGVFLSPITFQILKHFLYPEMKLLQNI